VIITTQREPLEPDYWVNIPLEYWRDLEKYHSAVSKIKYPESEREWIDMIGKIDEASSRLKSLGMFQFDVMPGVSETNDS